MNEWCHIWRIHITWNLFVYEWVSFTPFVSCLQAVWQVREWVLMAPSTPIHEPWRVYEWVSFNPFVSCLQAVWQAQRAINTHEFYHAKPGMWHVTYEQVTSCMHESRYIWTSEPMCVCTRHQHPWTLSQKTQVASYIEKSRLKWMSHVTYEWVTSYMNTRHQHSWTLSCKTRSSSHVMYSKITTDRNESCHIWVSHVSDEYAPSTPMNSIM